MHRRCLKQAVLHLVLRIKHCLSNFDLTIKALIVVTIAALFFVIRVIVGRLLMNSCVCLDFLVFLDNRRSLRRRLPSKELLLHLLSKELFVEFKFPLLVHLVFERLIVYRLRQFKFFLGNRVVFDTKAHLCSRTINLDGHLLLH